MKKINKGNIIIITTILYVAIGAPIIALRDGNGFYLGVFVGLGVVMNMLAIAISYLKAIYEKLNKDE